MLGAHTDVLRRIYVNSNLAQFCSAIFVQFDGLTNSRNSAIIIIERGREQELFTMEVTTMMNAICYKTTNPTIYNKGTKWEKTCDTFLAYYTHKNDVDAQNEVDFLNTTKPATLFNGEPALCEERTYFVNKQEEM